MTIAPSNMAQAERDNANPVPDERNLDNPRNTYPKRADRPLFQPRKATERKIFGKTNDWGLDEGLPASLRERPGNGNWLSGNKTSGLKLSDAFKLTQDDGALESRSRQIDPRSAALGRSSSQATPRPKRHSIDAGSTSPKNLMDFALPMDTGERSSSVPVDYERVGVGSPSPGARRMRYNRDGAGSDTSGSSLSGITPGDDLERKIHRRRRDEERIAGALASKQGLFAKPDVGAERRPSSASSLDKEPPSRPPNTWGSKAKTRKSVDWMGDIRTSPKIQALPLSPQEDGKLRADIPLQSVENVASIHHPTPPTSRPSSAQPGHASPEQSDPWDVDADFTAQSLQMSTPFSRAKISKLDEIRSKELQGFSAREVARNKLEEIKERNSEERSLPLETTSPLFKPLSPKENMERSEREETPFQERTILEEEGEQIRGTPITIFSGSSYNSNNNSNTPRPKTAGREGEEGRAGREDKSEDPRDFLRQLSRRSSASPSPARPAKTRDRVLKTRLEEVKDEAAKLSPENLAINARDDTQSKASHTKRHSTASAFSMDADPEERIAAEASLFELPDTKSERNSYREPSVSPPRLSSDHVKEDETPKPKPRPLRNSFREVSLSPPRQSSDYAKEDKTPKPKPNPLSLPTPKVTGAYVETPALIERKPRNARSVSPMKKADAAPLDRPTRSERTAAFASGRQTAKAEVPIARPSRSEQRSEQVLAVPSTQQRTSRSPRRPARELAQTMKLERPSVINTAKPITAAEDLRRLQRELDIDDATLDNLSAILDAPGLANDDSFVLVEPILDPDYDERGQPLSSKEKERRDRVLALARMKKSLLTTTSSIADARLGIERLEEQVASSKSESTFKSTPSSMFEHKETKESKSEQYPHVACDCETPHTQALHMPIPRLWTHLPPTLTHRHPWRFTRLGLLLFLFLAWYLSESLMCHHFCHPYNSSSNKWKPSDPFFPWAIPTKLDQWTGEAGSAAIEMAITACGGDGRKWRYDTPPWYWVWWRSLTLDDWWVGNKGPAQLMGDRVRWMGDDEMI